MQPGALFFFWLFLKALRFYRNDDFQWWVTVETWNDLQQKLDGLTNAIHKRDIDSFHQPGIDMPVLPPSQTPLVDQPLPYSHGQSFPTPPSGDPRGLGINVARDQEATSTGYFRELPLERPQMAYNAPWVGEDLEHYGEPSATTAGLSQQSTRRRSIRDTYGTP